MSPFSPEIAREIGVKHHWKCEECGKRFQEGWLVDMAHYPDKHNKKLPEYNSTESGRPMCLVCHFREHVDMGDYRSASMVATRIYRNGLRHREVYARHPDWKESDWLQFVDYMDSLGLRGKIGVNMR